MLDAYSGRAAAMGRALGLEVERYMGGWGEGWAGVGREVSESAGWHGLF